MLLKYSQCNLERGFSNCIECVCCSEVKLDDPGQENMTLRWQNRIISNFEYLEYLNRSVFSVI